MLIAVCIFLWWALGASGFIFWVTADDDLRVGGVIFAGVIGLLGPMTWLIGAAIHGKFSERVVFKKRGG